MAQQWVSEIRKRGTLKVFDGTTGKWANAITPAMNAFNALSKQYGLRVALTPAGREADADVVVKVAAGVASYEYGGAKVQDTLSGYGTHGRTHLFAGDDGIQKVVTFLPGNTGDLNQGMLEVIATHEFVHACGLNNQEHGDNGLFYSPLEPGNGKMIVPEKGKQNRPMPPMFLAPGTVAKIQSVWKNK